jgi:hypothetical protein
MLTDVALTPIAETIRQLSAQRRSGDLQVRSARVVKIAFFDHGRLVFASSNLRRDRLGEGLVADTRITPEEFELVSSLMRTDQGPRRFGEALVTAGVMDRYEVGSQVARQVRRIVLSLFALADGAALFEERPCAIPLDYMVSLSVHRLLYDGIRLMKSEPLVLAGLGPLDRNVVLAEVPPFPYEPKDSTEETEILELARRRVTVRRLAWGTGGLSFTRLRATYALLGAGLLQEADQPAAPQPVLHGETGTFLLSGLHQKPQPSGREAIRREVERELSESARLNRDEWLQRAGATGAAELLRALEHKMDRYHELSEGVRPDDSLRIGVETVLGRLSMALRVVRRAAGEEQVRDAAARTAAPTPTGASEAEPAAGSPAPIRHASGRIEGKPTPEQRAAAAVTLPGFGLPPVVRRGPAAPAAGPAPAAPVAAARAAVSAPAAAPAAAAPAAGKAVVAASRPAGPDALAPVAAPAGAPPAATAAVAAPAAAPEAVPVRVTAPAPGAPVVARAPAGTPDQSIPMVAPGASDFEGQALVEHLLMEGEVRMTVSDYANAVQVYQKLVDAAPHVAVHHLRLATAMACWPRTAKLAEREYYEAARLEPDNADIHFQWGLYYKVMKVKSRATAEMRAAVRLNPRHRAARAELQLLSPKDTALTSLKKLFK